MSKRDPSAAAPSRAAARLHSVETSTHSSFDELRDAVRLAEWTHDAGRGDLREAIKRVRQEINVHEEQLALAIEYREVAGRLHKLCEADAQTKKQTRRPVGDMRAASIRKAEAELRRLDKYLADAGLLDLEQPAAREVVEQSLELVRAQLAQLESSERALGQRIPVAPDHLLTFTREALLGAYRWNAPRSDPGNRGFFARLARKLGSAQVRPVVGAHQTDEVVGMVRDILGKAGLLEAAFEEALHSEQDRRRKPRPPTYRPIAECIYDATVAYSVTVPRPGSAGSSIRGLQRYGEQVIRAVQPPSIDEPLPPGASEIITALREAGRGLTTEPLLTKAHGKATSEGKRTLAELARRGLLKNPRRGGGYLLPGWSDDRQSS